VKEKGQKAEIETVVSELSWPKLHWRATTYFTAVSGLLTILLFAFPGLSEGRFDQYRILIAVLIIIFPFILFTGIPWLYRAIPTIVKRVIYYTEIRRAYLETKRDFTELKKTMVEYLTNQIDCRKLEINLAGFKDGKIYLLLLRKSEVNIEIGDIVEVIDSRDYMPMGQFEITEIRSEVYYAEEASHVDKLWLGYVKEHGETKFSPNMIACHIPRGGNDG